MAERIGFIGVGSMGEALVKGMIEAELFCPQEVVISDVDQERLSEVKAEYGVQTVQQNTDLISQVDYLVLAVKPKVIDKVMAEIGSKIKKEQKLFSIAAGVSTAQIENYLSAEVPVVRLMPNTPALINEGAIAYTLGTAASSEEETLVEKLFCPVGKVVQTEEKLMDAVTGLSGSGPAYIYILIEALSDAGVYEGLSREAATNLAVQTVMGAAKMVADSDAHPAELKDKVTSPGGTTITGVKNLEEAGFRTAVQQAVAAAAKQSRQLGEE